MLKNRLVIRQKVFPFLILDRQKERTHMELLLAT